MISCLRGVLLESGPDSLILDVNGIGFEVLINQRISARLPRVGGNLFIHTYMQVLENEFKLYGFLEPEELRLFKKLLGVSGMGAKGSMNVLSFMEPASFYQAIASSDEKHLTKIPGIGKKTAGRLIFELREKIEKIDMLAAVDKEGDSIEEVLEALETLGYGRSEVYNLLMDMKKEGHLGESVEENIKQVLKMKARRMK